MVVSYRLPSEAGTLSVIRNFGQLISPSLTRLAMLSFNVCFATSNTAQSILDVNQNWLYVHLSSGFKLSMHITPLRSALKSKLLTFANTLVTLLSDMAILLRLSCLVKHPYVAYLHRDSFYHRLKQKSIRTNWYARVTLLCLR